MTKIKLQIEENQYTYLHKWNVENPIAVLHLIHGSMEHIGRYKEMVQYLNDKGIAVYGMDLRGHGVSAIEQGTHGNIDSYKRVNGDIDMVNEEIAKDHPGIKIVMFGHSMGSFVLRHYLTTHKEYDAIICGTNEQDVFSTYGGLAVARLTKLFKGKRKINHLIDNISYKGFNKKMGPGEDWGSNRPGHRAEFNSDKINTLKGFTNESFIAMLSWLKEIRKPRAYKNHKGKLFIISGSKDPVGRMGKGPKVVAKKYKKHGADVKLKIYEGGHHEVHNDINKEETFKDIVKFIKEI